MPELSHIDPRSAALLVMDYQVDTLTKFMTAAQSADAIACVPDLIAHGTRGKPIVVKPASARSLAPTWRRCCAPTASTRWCSPVSTPAAACCRPFATPAIWIIGWSSSAIAAPTQMQRCMRCRSTSSSRSRRPLSPRRSPAPCLAGLHERTRARMSAPGHDVYATSPRWRRSQ